MVGHCNIHYVHKVRAHNGDWICVFCEFNAPRSNKPDDIPVGDQATLDQFGHSN